jgi:hypothetical protein
LQPVNADFDVETFFINEQLLVPLLPAFKALTTKYGIQKTREQSRRQVQQISRQAYRQWRPATQQLFSTHTQCKFGFQKIR